MGFSDGGGGETGEPPGKNGLKRGQQKTSLEFFSITRLSQKDDSTAMTDAAPSLEGLRVAALESRRRDDMERLIVRFGGQAFVSPSMREVPIAENRPAIEFAYRVITGEFSMVIFLTGVGLKHLITAIEKSVDRQRFIDALSDITTVVRGPKSGVAMKELGLTPTIKVPEPNTWRELLKTLDQHGGVANQKIGVQEYGQSNTSLIAGLEARGAQGRAS